MGMREDYIRAYAVGMVKDGYSAAEAVKAGEKMWDERQRAEKAVDEEMKK